MGILGQGCGSMQPTPSITNLKPAVHDVSLLEKKMSPVTMPVLSITVVDGLNSMDKALPIPCPIIELIYS